MNNHTFVIIPESVADWIVHKGVAFFAHFVISIFLMFFRFFSSIAFLFFPFFSLLLTEQGKKAYHEITQNRVWLEQCDTFLYHREESQ